GVHHRSGLTGRRSGQLDLGVDRRRGRRGRGRLLASHVLARGADARTGSVGHPAERLEARPAEGRGRGGLPVVGARLRRGRGAAVAVPAQTRSGEPPATARHHVTKARKPKKKVEDARQSLGRLERILILVPYCVRNPGSSLEELAHAFGTTSEEIVADL